MIDNTRAKQAERELSKREARLRSITRSSAIGVVVTDQQGRYLEVNDAFLSLIGYSRSELESRSLGWYDLTPPEYIEVTQRSVQEVWERGLCEPFEKQYFHRNGHRVDILVTRAALAEEPGCIISLIFDITDRKRAERELQASEARLRQVIQSNLIGIFTASIHGEILSANDAFLDMVGYSRQELQAGLLDWLAMTPPELYAREVDGIERILKERFVPPFEKQYIRKDGRLVDVLIAVSLLPGSQDEALCFVVDVTDRKRAENALRESELRYSLIVEAASDGIWDWNLADNQLFWSDRFLEMLGLPEKTIANLDLFWSLVHPDDIDRVEQTVRAHLDEQKPYQLMMRLRHSDGEYRTFLCQGQAIWDENGRPLRMAGAIADITEQRQAEEALRESEKRFRAMADSAPVLIWTAGPDGQNDYFNKPWLDFVGSTLEAELGTGWLRHLHPDDRQSRMSHFLSQFYQRLPFKVEYRLRRHDGVYRWVLSTGVPRLSSDGEFMGYVGSCLDITDRKEAEESIRESERFVKSTFNSLHARIVIIDETARIVSSNQSWVQYCEGLSGCEGHRCDIDVNFFQLLPQVLADETYFRPITTGIQNILHGHANQFALEYPANSDKGRIWHYMVAQRFIGEGPVRIVISNTDISQRKMAEEALRAMTRRLVEANRELNDFATIASHDLQEPLRKVLAFSERLQATARDQLDPRARNYLERIDGATHRMQVLISSLLEYSRLTTRAQQFTQVNLDGVLSEVLADLEHRIESQGATFQCARLATIQADALQIRQLFQNLLSNALKYHQAGVPPEIRISSRPSRIQDMEPAIEITVADNGIGFDEKYAERIFKAFQRLHNRQEFEGTGIGLTICKKIVERHRGEIRAESQPGQGSRFIITLPLSQSGHPDMLPFLQPEHRRGSLPL